MARRRHGTRRAAGKVRGEGRRARVGFLIGMLLSIFACAQQPGGSERQLTANYRLYGFATQQLESFLDDHGHRGVRVEDVTRNPDGTGLRLFSWTLGKAFLVRCGGELKEIQLPGRRVWLDAAGRPVAWLDDGRLRFATGQSIPGNMNPYWADSDGEFFLVPPPWDSRGEEHALMEIRAMASPATSVARVAMRDVNARLFRIGSETLMLVGSDASRPDRSKVLTFDVRGATLKEQAEMTIEAPSRRFFVLDVTPDGDNLLFVDARDFPTQSRWYRATLPAGRVEKVGEAMDYGFFLRCNPLSTRDLVNGNGEEGNL
jgi:hypothetical protein